MIRIDPALLAELRLIPWFKNCGKPATAITIPTRQLSNWKEAAEAGSSNAWVDATEEAHGQLTEYLSSRHPSDYQGVWNRLVREVRPHVESSAATQATAIAVEFNLGQSFVDAVRSDLLGAIMERIYISKNPPKFFTSLYEIYKSGHYPCGIDADGTLVIY